MASAPSASALSAVVRCRGRIWSRNPPAKRPGPAKRRGDSAERGGQNRSSERKVPTRGGPSVACRWEVFRKQAELSAVKLWVPAAPPVRTGPLLRVLTPSSSVTVGLVPPGVLKLTVTSRFLPETLCLGSKLKVTCWPSTSLRSRVGPVWVKMFWSSCSRRSGDPQRHLLEHRSLQQADGRTAASSQDRVGSGPEVTRDRPDQESKASGPKIV
ncbi:uncharacterized protein LOC106532614 [Austrofundulus limnaeus]|uniref:Uncharacterized protein LOC106532614 n=1 Tax=Austrofundulus limnaeus TaxID=52670 RepID=A0A2I4CW21_AUSLI|nr:PREDICTED: uncharacterized protein LOC106532614 [Austrofundulus limnaeus]